LRKEAVVFALKKLLGDILMPFPVALGLLFLGLILLWSARRKNTAIFLVTLSALMLGSAGIERVSDYVVRSLERKYPPLVNPSAFKDAEWIVVLSPGQTDDKRVPALDRLGDDTVIRLVYGIRLYRMLPGTKLLLSGGGAGPGINAIADNMKTVARELGVPGEDIAVDGSSFDTADQAVLIGRMLKKKRFILVTSATHMPRAVALFKKQGLDPIPAPTRFTALEDEADFDAHKGWMPDAENLVALDGALHEYLGIAWSWFRGQI